MITSILEFFALGTFGFWLLCSLLSIVFIACIENENHWLPTVASIALAAIYWKGFVALGMTWQGVAIGVLVYAVAGMVWSIYRWYRFVKEQAEDYRKRYGTSLTDSQRRDLKSDISVSSNKALITGWIAYWPWSLVWNVTGDFFKTIYEQLQGVYQRIVDKALGGFSVQEEKVETKDRYGR
jgi:hypothetical protein